MKLGCLGLIIGVSLVWGGGQGTFTALKNREMTVISIDEVIDSKPEAKWLRITDGQIDIFESVVSESRTGNVTDYYLPIVSKNAKEGDPIHVIYHTDEPQYRQMFAKMERLMTDPETDEGERLLKVAELTAKMSEGKTFVGLVEFGVNSDRTDEKAKNLFDNLAPNALLLEGGKEPEMMTSVIMLVAGIALFGVGFLGSKKG